LYAPSVVALSKTLALWIIKHPVEIAERTFTALSGVSQAWSIALGAPKSSGGYPALYAAANISGLGYFRSDDQGKTWVKINDAQHGFGAISGNPITADPRKYGRVYVVGGGRGVFYGDIA
ncbi:hypothetical protein MPER_02691, partial [Moniliophthora perniciosa FA553]